LLSRYRVQSLALKAEPMPRSLGVAKSRRDDNTRLLGRS
jgi:hypothetical protein